MRHHVVGWHDRRMPERRARFDRDERPDLDVFEDRLRARERDEDDDTSPEPAEPSPAGSTEAQEGGPGVFELSGRFLDNVVEWGADQLDNAGELARDLGDSMSGFATAAAEVVGSAANSAWDGATGGGDDDDDGDDGDDGAESSGGDTISGGDLVELQTSPSEPIDPGAIVGEISPPSTLGDPATVGSTEDVDMADDVVGDDPLP